MSLAYYDGEFVARDSIAVNPADFGFSRGIAVFELARVYHGRPFHLEDHVQRLLQGAATLGIAPPLDEAGLIEAAGEIIARNRLPHSAIKFYLTAGECAQASGTSFGACAAFKPHLMIMEDEVKPRHPKAPYGVELYQRGQRLRTMPFERELPLVKSTNYMLGYYAARQAGGDCDDILFTHRDGYVTEATRSNFFCLIDDVLMTPGRGMLFGITRKVILRLASEIALPVQERDLTPTDLTRASEAFTTGSIAEILPAGQIDNHKLPTTNDGPAFRALRKAFSAYIEQVTGYS